MLTHTAAICHGSRTSPSPALAIICTATAMLLLAAILTAPSLLLI